MVHRGAPQRQSCGSVRVYGTANAQWEDQLRLRAGQETTLDQSFMQRWVGSLLFYDASERLFTMIYTGFFVLIVLTFWLVPPRRALK